MAPTDSSMSSFSADFRDALERGERERTFVSVVRPQGDASLSPKRFNSGTTMQQMKEGSDSLCCKRVILQQREKTPFLRDLFGSGRVDKAPLSPSNGPFSRSARHPFSIRVPPAAQHSERDTLQRKSRLVDEAENLAGDVLATGLLVVHDTGRGGLSNVREETIRGCPHGGWLGERLTRMMKPNERDGRRRATHFSMSGRRMLKRGLESERSAHQVSPVQVPVTRGGRWYSRDDTALVDATVELDNDLARAVVVDLLKLLNVACVVHTVVSVPSHSPRQARAD